ncbi:LysR family transcriptional regulator [Nocardia beijingensis]|uniref:LysR substrate-binding domain-containing protein n=1 Tax=Nocardia beijingensis TaxID=95162 RepID=UPI001893D2BD|nr:LysR substrate-binding domain-containing protein [Nocardia beijingensis]MBF6468683.1 LysR family transcriptional regulator [Nocardia beijingensis]
MNLPKLLDGRLKIRHLVLIDALTRRGSVGGAAVELHVTQPVATRGLQDVEDILGVALYERGPRGISPTIFGQAFTEHARAILAQLNAAGRHVLELADAERGTVSVGTHLAGSSVLLPVAIGLLKRTRPALTVIVREGTPEALLAELEAGRVDVIVGRLTSPTTEFVSRTPLYDETVRLYSRTQHPLAQIVDVPLDELTTYPWILPGVETSLRRELEEFFVRHGLDLPRNRVEVTSFLTVRKLLIENDFIAALPSLIAAEDSRLHALTVPLDTVGHSVGITTATTRALSPSAAALIDSLERTATSIRDLSG